MTPLITNERGRREWLWIVNRVGERTALEAICRLPGQSKPYPLNIARVLKLSLPDERDLPQTPEAIDASRQAAERELANMKKLLRF
jgi:hypothetical protein